MKENKELLGKLNLPNTAAYIYTPDNEDDWHVIRQKGIGGTDISVITGANTYNKPEDLLAEKLHGTRREQTAAMEWGKRLEAVVAQAYAEKNNVKILDVGGTISTRKLPVTDGDCPFLANIDRLILDENGKAVKILEVKTAHAFSRAWGTYDIPPHYFQQVNWYMGITGIYEADFAVLLGGRDYIERKAHFNSEMFDDQCEAARKWWQDHIIDKKPLPPLPSYEYTDDEDCNQKIRLTEMPDLSETASAYFQKNEEKKRLEEEIKELKTVIFDHIGKIDHVSTGAFIVHRRHRKGAETVDKKKLAADYPDIFGKVVKQGKPTEALEVILKF